MHYQVLFDHAHAHLEMQHSKGPDDSVSLDEWSHAVMRAAVAFLID